MSLQNKLTPTKDAELRQTLYAKMQEIVQKVDKQFQIENGDKIRERDIQRYTNYSLCLKEKASTPQLLKECSKHISSTEKKNEEVKKGIQEAKEKLYSCVNQRYSAYNLQSKRDEHPEQCLKMFEDDVLRSIRSNLG